MSFIRPATPGFIVTLVATILLAIVTFCVPYIKSVYFLRASITEGSFNGSIIFGTLGYCLELSNGTTCSKPSLGYELDINGLVGNKLPVQIPQVVVKWITYALVLHIVALVAAAGSAFFGLLAHIREVSMTCCSTCISGFAASIALLAFIFDLILFFIAKARINAIGSAQIGSAIWLTLAAWILLFFSGCFYSIGRCCIGNRPSRGYTGIDNSRDPEGGLKTAQGNHSAINAPAEGLTPHKYGVVSPANPQEVLYHRENNAPPPHPEQNPYGPCEHACTSDQQNHPSGVNTHSLPPSQLVPQSPVSQNLYNLHEHAYTSDQQNSNLLLTYPQDDNSRSHLLYGHTQYPPQ